jgi:hypothetical protein
LPMSMPAQRGRTMSIATGLLTLPAAGKAPIVAATASRAHPSPGRQQTVIPPGASVNL